LWLKLWSVMIVLFGKAVLAELRTIELRGEPKRALWHGSCQQVATAQNVRVRSWRADNACIGDFI
jgi:hypothetical protein